MDIENFIAEFKKTFVYDMLSMSLKDEQLFEHVVDDDGVLWFKEQTRQMWSMWQEAKAQAVPDGFVVVPKKPTWGMIHAGEDVRHSKFIVVGNIYKAMIEALEQAKAQAVLEIKPSRHVTLTCAQLREAFMFGAPDKDDQEQLETEMTIQWSDEGHSGAGYYCYYADYPEEGAIKLGEDQEPAND